MKTKFNCPHCNAPVEASSNQAGMAGDCPSCSQLLIIPAYTPPNTQKISTVQRVLPQQSAPQRDKTLEDYVADGICGTAKLGWKATKVAAPIAGRIAAKVAGRAAKAASETKVVKWLAEPPAKPPSALEQTGKVIYVIARLLGLS